MPRQNRTRMAAPSFPLLVVLTAILPAQDPPAKTPDPVMLVGKAERLVAKKEDVEDAALLLWQALAILATKPQNPMRDATAMTARYLLNEHDPLEKERRRVYESVAKQQVELAQAYRSRKWFDVAQTRVDVAMRFDRDAATKERALLESARPKPKPGAASAEKKEQEKPKLPPLMQRANTEFVLGEWREVGELLEVAAHPGQGGSLYEWMTRATHEDHDVVVEFRPADATKQHTTGIWVGWSSANDRTGYQAACQFDPASGTYGVFIDAHDGETSKELGLSWVKPGTPTDGFHRISVQVHGRGIRLQLDGAEPLEVQAAAPVRGQVGIVFGVSDAPSCSVQFRNFRIDPLPADAPTDEQVREQAQAEVQQYVTGFVDEAKTLIAKKQPEQASQLLRQALGELSKLPAGVLRTNLATSIEQMLTQTDSLAPKRKKAAQNIATELAGLADKYAAAGMARLALVLVEDAAGFDPDGQAQRLTAARESVQKWNLDQARARASELAPPADDGAVLREWFGQGKKLDSGAAGWQIEGPCARVPVLPPESCTAWMPKAGTPLLTKASVFVRLPPQAAAGFCFDVAGQYDYSVAVLDRQGSGLTLAAYRFAGSKWMQLDRKTIALDAWRLDGWFPIAIEATNTGLTVRGAGAEFVLDRKMLGNASGRFGLFATNGDKTPAPVELRAFQVPP